MGASVEPRTVFDRDMPAALRGIDDGISIDAAARNNESAVAFDRNNGNLVFGANARHRCVMNIGVRQESSLIARANETVDGELTKVEYSAGLFVGDMRRLRYAKMK